MQKKGMQILNFMGNSSKKILVHHEMDEIEVKGSMDIVLTPQFYTFLREELEIKFTYQAKNIAHAFFDDYLDLEQEYQYHVYKHGDEWYFFAYSVDEITSFLEEKGLPLAQIGKIYFAQELEESLLQPVKLGSRLAMQTIDGTVTLIPQHLVETEVEYHSLDLDKESFKQGIALSSSYSSIVPFKEMLMLTSLLLFLGGVFLFDGYRGRASIENIQSTRDNLIEENPKLASSMRRKSELKKYTKIDRVERLKRNKLMQISKIMAHKNRLKSLVLTEKNIVVTITPNSKQDIIKIKNLVKSNGFKLSKESEQEIILEIKL